MYRGRILCTLNGARIDFLIVLSKDLYGGGEERVPTGRKVTLRTAKVTLRTAGVGWGASAEPKSLDFQGPPLPMAIVNCKGCCPHQNHYVPCHINYRHINIYYRTGSTGLRRFVKWVTFYEITHFSYGSPNAWILVLGIYLPGNLRSLYFKISLLTLQFTSMIMLIV